MARASMTVEAEVEMIKGYRAPCLPKPEPQLPARIKLFQVVLPSCKRTSSPNSRNSFGLGVPVRRCTGVFPSLPWMCFEVTAKTRPVRQSMAICYMGMCPPIMR